MRTAMNGSAADMPIRSWWIIANVSQKSVIKRCMYTDSSTVAEDLGLAGPEERMHSDDSHK